MIYRKKTTHILSHDAKEHNYLKEELYDLIKKDANIFDFIQGAVLDGLWFWDLDNPENEWMSSRFWTVLGYDPDQMPHKSSSWQNIINHEDLKNAIQNFVKHCQDPTYPYDQIVRYTHRLGHTVWIRCRGLAIRNSKGKPIRMIGAHTDITSFEKVKLSLKKQNERYKHVIDSTNLGIWEINCKTQELIINENWADILGYTLLELQPFHKNIRDKALHPKDLEYTRILKSQHIKGFTDHYECEIRMRHKNGDWIWVAEKGKIISWDEAGNPEWMIGSILEITESKKTIEENKAFIEQAPSAIALLDKNMRYLAVSKKWIDDYKIKEPEILGKTHYEIFPEIPDRWKEDHRRALQGECFKKDEDKFIRKDGSHQWISWELRPWYTDQKEIGGLIMQTEDITYRKITELQNYEKQVFQETILNSINVGLASCNEHGELTMFNAVTQNWFGLPNNTIPVEEWPNYYGLFQKDGVTPLQEEEIPLLKALHKGKFKDYEIILTPNNGKKRLVSTNGAQLVDAEGKVTGAVVALHDITEKNEVIEQLRVSEESFRGNFEHAAIGMAILDIKGKWLEINMALSSIIGYTIQELNTLTLKNLTHPDDHEEDQLLLQELLTGRRSYFSMEKRFMHKKGQVVHVILSMSLIRDKFNFPLKLIAQVVDVTPRIIARKDLKQTVQRLESVLQASSRVGIIETNYDGKVTMFNKGAENLLGYAKEEVLHLKSLPDFYKPEEIEKRGCELSERFGYPIKDFEVFTTLAKELDHDTREWICVTKDGTHLNVQLTITSVKRNEIVSGYLAVITNISQLKETETELKSLLCVTSDQNKRLRNFAHIVSHNLKSHSGNFEMLLDIFIQENMGISKSEPIQMLKKASSNLAETIKHLNEVVLINTSIKDNLEGINLQNTIKKVLRSVVALAQEGQVTIKYDIDADIRILGVPAYLDSILLNLITNGIKYRSTERNSYINISSVCYKDQIEILVEDNGIGIDLDMHHQRIFGMYKTFHNNKDARGIGLFISKNQVEAMGGSIAVESIYGQGTIFKVKLSYENSKKLIE
ncbi:PAS domain S-box protein [Aquimarina sp. ERC-38]|uniref:PAS domain-containing protein n=1 Tax=Aquimarina sp. ERC-38 TaxID=2949996 RepID=UPI002245BA6B|nr:PAS domain S-box protein [Aquimarina sp. ERC-38]UZO80986.1 PAS domain S-box protein [Aquimarina sp. ERC-38]